MTNKLTEILKDSKPDDNVASRVREWEHRFGDTTRGGRDARTADYQNYENIYYDLVTDLFEYGWGKSFHFAPRAEGESFAASLARHEHYIAHRLRLGPGMLVADLGCGIGGPLREIARFSGARIVGVNNNAYQLKRAAELTEVEHLSHLAEYLKCDFMDVDAPDNFFDAIYSVESTCCAPDKTGVYGEAFRLLKPGKYLAVYEWCMTDRYDAENPDHRRVKAEVEYGNAMPNIAWPQEIDDALRQVGFELLETHDMLADAQPGIPWYEPLTGGGLSFASVRSSTGGRWLTHSTLWLLENLRVVPRGTTRVSSLLNRTATVMAEAGRLGIFSPMYFMLARKPD